MYLKKRWEYEVHYIGRNPLGVHLSGLFLNAKKMPIQKYKNCHPLTLLDIPIPY